MKTINLAITGLLLAAPHLASAKEINLNFDKEYLHGSNHIDLKEEILNKKPNFNFDDRIVDRVDVIAWSRNGGGNVKLEIGSKNTPREKIAGGEENGFSTTHLYRPSRLSQGDWSVNFLGHVKLKAIKVQLRDPAPCKALEITKATAKIFGQAQEYRQNMEGLSTRERNLDKVRSEIQDVVNASRSILILSESVKKCEKLQREAWKVGTEFFELLDRVAKIDKTLSKMEEMSDKDEEDKKDMHILRRVIKGFKQLNKEYRNLGRRI